MSRNVPRLRFKGFEEEWKEKKLGALGSFLKGNGLSKADLSESGQECILYGELYTKYNEVISNVKSKTNIESKNAVRSKSNDVIIPSSGETAIAIATASCVQNGNVILGGDLNIFRPSDIDGVFISYQLNNSRKKEIAKIAQGASVVHVYNEQLKKVKVKLTTVQEQEKIANFLTKVDSYIEKQDEKVKELNLYKKGMMQKIFSQEIRFKDENGYEYIQWEEKKLKNVCTINQGLQIAIADRFTEYKEGRYFYITNEFLKSGSEKKYYIENPTKNVICTENDILMTRTGNTGKVVSNVSGAFHNNFFKVNYDKDIVFKEFIYYFLTSNKTQKNILRLAGSSTIPDLNHNDFYNIKIQIPCLEEQIKIANFLSNIDDIIEKENKKLEELRLWKKGLLQQMFV